MFLEPRKHAANIEIIIIKHKLFLISTNHQNPKP